MDLFHYYKNSKSHRYVVTMTDNDVDADDGHINDDDDDDDNNDTIKYKPFITGNVLQP